MVKIISLFLFFATFPLYANCQKDTELIVIGDSQTGATWSRTYFGDYLQQCLTIDFRIYAQGGSIIRTWLDDIGLQKIDIVERTSDIEHRILGKREKVPACKKDLRTILREHSPKKVLYFFGDNYIASTNDSIIKEVDRLMQTNSLLNISKEQCYFLTPTYEMEVSQRRNVTRKYLDNTIRIRDAITKGIKGRCQIIDGVKLMQDSNFFNGSDKLRRVSIPGDVGCSGAASNDNIHVCGEAARDLALKVCNYF